MQKRFVQTPGAFRLVFERNFARVVVRLPLGKDDSFNRGVIVMEITFKAIAIDMICMAGGFKRAVCAGTRNKGNRHLAVRDQVADSFDKFPVVPAFGIFNPIACLSLAIVREYSIGPVPFETGYVNEVLRNTLCYAL